ncbi:MAG: hypothetical protein LBV41_04515 [Cytophagaceae bacterium]|jgi:hypothetical protein|nr:hypothetical protein [Cytophagaceae bacterium]
MKFQLVRYDNTMAKTWDEFVSASWNGVFLFLRPFVDYHSHIFTDHSLLACQDGKLKAVFPANESGGALHSHQGLTYGGWILAPRVPADDLDVLFQLLEEYAKANGFNEIMYKHKPFVFDRHLNDTDAWILWKNGYELWRRDLSFIIDFKNFAGFARDKRYRLNKSIRNNLRLDEQGDIKQFMELVKKNLNRKYNTNPVHTPGEVELLQKRFPKNIFTLVVFQEDEFLGGTLLFVDNDFIHTQYLHFNDNGRNLCAAEFLIDSLMNKYGQSKRYLSFGTSTDNNGKALNSGLASFKEGFGAAGFCHDFYRKKLIPA